MKWFYILTLYLFNVCLTLLTQSVKPFIHITINNVVHVMSNEINLYSGSICINKHKVSNHIKLY